MQHFFSIFLLTQSFKVVRPWGCETQLQKNLHCFLWSFRHWTTDQLLRSRCRGTALHAKTREGGHTRIDFAGYSWVNLYFMVILQLLTIHHFHPPGWKHNRYLPPLSVGTTQLKFAALIKLWKYNRQPHRALRRNNTWGVRMRACLAFPNTFTLPFLALACSHTHFLAPRCKQNTHYHICTSYQSNFCCCCALNINWRIFTLGLRGKTSIYILHIGTS